MKDGFKEPIVQLDYEYGMSACGFDSTLFMVDPIFRSKKQPAYSLDIQHHQQQQLKNCLGAAHLRKLPDMLGGKRSALMTHIPGTKKILVFSSSHEVYTFNPNRTWPVNDNALIDDEEDGFVDDDDDIVDFEMLDVETELWEKLPDLVVRRSYTNGIPSYFLYQSVDGVWVEIPGEVREPSFSGFQISRYTFIDEGAAFVVQTSTGVVLALDLGSPSKGWKLYSEGGIVKPSTSSDQNLFVVMEKRGFTWCACGKLDNGVSFPLSSLDSEKDPLKKQTWTSLTLMEGDKKGKMSHVCIVQGGVGKRTMHPRMIVDVVEVEAFSFEMSQKCRLVASARFEVKKKCRSLLPFCMFVYHPSN